MDFRCRMGLLAFLAVGAVSLSGREAPPVEIDFPIFVGGFGSAFFEQRARAYEALHPGVKINLYGDPRIANKLRVRVIGEDYPDATDAELPWVDLIEAGKVLDLAPWLDGPAWDGSETWRESFLPGALSRWHLEGATYAVPFGHAAVVVFYNKALFRENGWEVPATWEEFFALCTRIRSTGVAPVALPGVYARYIDNYFRAAHYGLLGPKAYGRYLRLEPGAHTDPAFIRAAAVVQELAMNHLQAGWEGMTHTTAQLEFFQGRAAMVSTGSWLPREMRGKIPPDFELGAFNFPVFPDNRAPATHIQTGSGYYFVFADTPHVDTTVDFLRFLTSRASALAFAEQEDSLAAIRGVPVSAFSPAMRDVAALLRDSTGSYGQPPGSAGLFPRLNQARTGLRLQLLRGAITPEAYGAALEAEAAALRAAAENPGAVQVRHPWKTAGLLGFLCVAVLLAARRRGRGEDGAARAWENSFGDLRWPMFAVFVAPALLLYLAFIILPSVEAAGWALVRWNGIGEPAFHGLRHFRTLLLESDVFWTALGNNLFLMFVPGLVIIPMATFFAWQIHRGIWGGRVFRTCFLFPNILGGVAATILWLSAYEPAAGLVNAVLVGAGQAFHSVGLDGVASRLAGFERFAWLAPERLYGSMLPILVWQGCGFNLILLLAAMDGIDPQLYEAANLEGARPSTQFFRITLPMIWDTLLVVLVFWIIAGLNAFELVWLLTGQEPASASHVLSTWMVNTLFHEFQVGRSTAIAVTLFALVFAGALLTWKGLRREATA